MPIIADWAKGTVISGVTNAYIGLVQNGLTFDQDISSRITGFSYRGLLNFSGGSLLLCIFLTAIFMYMIDRKFIRAAMWSLLAAVFALFGLINAPGVGVLVEKNDDGWKFTVAYVMMAVLFGCFEIAQRRKWIKQPETEPDDLSSNEWAQWNREQLAGENHINQDDIF
jgi:AGZA family xanthine/uracil permease-like MFS transporter